MEAGEGLGEGPEEEEEWEVPPFMRVFTLWVRAAVVAVVELACR